MASRRVNRISGAAICTCCARAGVKVGDGDPYEGLDLPRKDVKLAINVMLNAPSWPSVEPTPRLPSCRPKSPCARLCWQAQHARNSVALDLAVAPQGGVCTQTRPIF